MLDRTSTESKANNKKRQNMNANDVDSETHEFHAQGRRRKARVFAIAGVAIIICSVALAAFLLFTWNIFDEKARLEGFRERHLTWADVVLLILALAPCGIGIAAIVRAIRVGAGTINDCMKDR